MLSSQAAVVRVPARTGYPVIKAWAGKNHGQMGTVRGVMRHHTGTGVNYARLDDYPTLHVVQVGRRDLPGPLCTWGIGRSGAIYVVNDQIAWHAGAGVWNGVTDGNGHFWAIEAESDGTYWTPALTDSYHRLVASALYELGLGWEWTPRHAGYARPVGRKTDSAGMDEALFERRVRAMLADPRTINRNYAGGAAAGTQEDDVPAQDVWNYGITNPASKIKSSAAARLLDVEVTVAQIKALVVGDEKSDKADTNTVVGKLDSTGGRLQSVEADVTWIKQALLAIAAKQGVALPPAPTIPTTGVKA